MTWNNLDCSVEQHLDGVMMALSLTKKTCTTIEVELGRLFVILKRERNARIENHMDVIIVTGEISDNLYCRY
tara:strand:+ start:1480 stop:1695 length:216 start_codon:yes stop_codon:yes gene_type:complete